MWKDMSMESSDIVQLIAAFILTALGIALGNSPLYAYSLIIAAFLLLMLVVFKHIRKVYPKVYFDQLSVRHAASRIYETAARNGGRLIATHIVPKVVVPSEDMALKSLKKVDKPLEYKRFIFIEDKLLEDKWIRETLNSVDADVQRSIYFIERSLVLPNVIWSVIPRGNILLYNKGNKYSCLLGLDQLQMYDEQYKRYNFAIEFHSEEVFNILHRYFESIVANPYVKNIKSVSQYPPEQKAFVIRPEIQSILTDLFALAKSVEEILHVGIFGKMALCLNGLQKVEDWKEHESDIDVMVIVAPGSTNLVKEFLSKTFKEKAQVEIVWGDDLDYFYFFRKVGGITVDIEVHERGTEFYKEHPLLGCSIFAYYWSLFPETGSYLNDLLHIPYGFHSMDDRIKILLEDRKGLRDFEQRMKDDSPEIDPRRIVSLCVKNLAWAISGQRPPNTQIALDFLSSSWMRFFPTVENKRIRELLSRDANEVRKSYKLYRELSEKVVVDAINFCQK